MWRARAVGTRLRSRRLVVADIVIAVALIVLAAAQDWSWGPPAVRVVAIALPLAVALRRLAPVPVALVTMAGVAITGAQPASAVFYVVITFTSYLAGRRCADQGRRLTAAGLLAVALFVAGLAPSVSLSGAPHLVAAVWVWGFFFAAPFASGWWIGAGARLNAELRATLEVLEGEQEEGLRRAAVEERIRVARELHDVVAHNVSVMVIQMAAARRVVASDPAVARGALAAVQASGQEAAADLRRMIGLVHPDDPDLRAAAVPGLAQLAVLAERAQAAGLALEISVEGEARPLPAALDLVSFRIAQEAVTNSIKHAAPCQAWLRVTFGSAALELEVVDTGHGLAAQPQATPLPLVPGASGHGLTGMRERVSLYGGELDAGPLLDGGFRVHAQLPLTAAAPQ